MNFYFTAILALSVVSAHTTVGFKIDNNVSKNPQALAHKISLEDASAPIVTETAPGQFHVRLGQREPTILSTHVEDCGSFSYPVGGGNYQNNEDIVFLVNPQSSGPRDISFTHFNTESSYDYVSIFVWENNQFVLVNRYSGTTGPTTPIRAPNGRFLVAFTSDSSVTRTGFTVTWYRPIAVQEKDVSVVEQKFTLEDSHTPVITESAEGMRVQLGDRSVPVVQVSADCGSFGSFSYPSDGGNYGNNEDVAFLVISESSGPREIAFSRFDTELSYDFVSVFVWENNQFRLAGRYSGFNRPAPIVAPHGRTLISFTSDVSITRSGFTALFYERN